MRRFLTTVGILAVLAAAPARAADPSEACDTGLVPPATTPAGAGVRVTTEPMKAAATACVAATPLPGHVKATAGAGEPSATIAIDGDPSADMLGCTDGYTAASAGAGGVSLYHSPDGGFTSRARAKTPAEIADSVQKNCTPPASA